MNKLRYLRRMLPAAVCLVLTAIHLPALGVGAAPVMTSIPDMQIGDLEYSGSNWFVFSNAFQFSTKVQDPDTTHGALRWSFAEYYEDGSPYSDTRQEFEINGKGPVAVGKAAIAAETTSGMPTVKNPGSRQLNTGSDYASLRDILFSPTGDVAPFGTGIGSLTADQLSSSAVNGKTVVFYVADPEGNVTQDVVKIATKDQGFDTVPFSFGTDWTFDQGSPTGHSPTLWGWSESGLNSSVSLGGVDDVDRTDNTGTLNPFTPTLNPIDIGIIVRASSGRYRVLGWINKTGIAYPGPNKYARAKFYVYTNNSAAHSTNKFPNFRARLQHGGAYASAANYQYAATGNTGGVGGDFPYSQTDSPAAEAAAGIYLRPSHIASKPSLYRVDMDPIDVPAAATRPIQPAFESFAFNDPAEASLMLTQCAVGSFPALTDEQGVPIMSYSVTSNTGFITPFAAFNAENSFTFGYRQKIFLGTTGFATCAISSGAGSTGILMDTGSTNPNYIDRYVVGIVDVLPSSNASRPRIQPNKYYRARFYATSDLPTTAASTTTTRQGSIRFRLQTAMGVANSYLDFAGAISSWQNVGYGDIYRDSVLGGQVLPGTSSLNPDKSPNLEPSDAAYNGGWYTVLMPSPLNGDIRRDVSTSGEISGATFGNLLFAPGAGDPRSSSRDIRCGIDVYSNPLILVMDGVTLNYVFDANRGKVAVTAIMLYEYDFDSVTNDGGYQY